MRIKFYLLISLFFSSVCFSDQLIILPEMGRTPIINAMQATKHSLDLVMYGFTDPELLQPLLELQNKGKTVKIILEGKPFRAESENTKFLKLLYGRGTKTVTTIPTIQYIHQKTMLIDEAKAWIMTFNFTKSTFKKQRNFALLIDDPNRVRIIQNRFDSDYAQSAFHETHPALIWSPEDSRQQYLNLIRSARSQLKVYAQDISDEAIVDALIKAAHKGLNIEVITSIHFKPTIQDRFEKAGIRIYFSKKMYIHAKAMIVDKKQAAVGSVNFTRGSLDDNRELAAITTDDAVIQQLIATFNSDKSALEVNAVKNKKHEIKHSAKSSQSSFDRSFLHWLKNTIKHSIS